MAEFKNYKEVAFLLSKAVQGQLNRKGGGNAWKVATGISGE